MIRLSNLITGRKRIIKNKNNIDVLMKRLKQSQLLVALFNVKNERFGHRVQQCYKKL